MPIHEFSDISITGALSWPLALALAEKGVEVYVVSNHTYFKNIQKEDLNKNIKLYTIGKCKRSFEFDKRCLFLSWLISLPLLIFKKIDFVFLTETIASPYHKFKIKPLAVRLLKGWDYANPKYGHDLLYDHKRKKAELGLIEKKIFLEKFFDFPFEIFFKLLKIKSHLNGADIIFYQVKSLLNDLLKNKKNAYLPNGVDINLFYPLKHKRESGNFIYLFIGRIGKRKGVGYLIEAFNKLNIEFNDTELWLVGSGAPDTIAWLKSKINSANTKIIDQVPRDEIINYFQQADIFVLPSLGESFSASILEAMAVGLPVITTADGGVMDYFIDGKNGFLVKPADSEDLYQAMKKIYLHQEMIEPMGKYNRDFVSQNFTWDNLAGMVVKAFENFRQK